MKLKSSYTPFARTIITALASRPHPRDAGSYFLGTSILRTGLRFGGRERKQIKNRGFTPEVIGASGLPELDVAELVHIHGRRIPNIIKNAGSIFASGDTRSIVDVGSAVGSLHWTDVSAQEQAQGAVGWTRLCVDTDQTERVVTIFDDRHLDVVIAPVGQEPGEYATDMAGILPQGIPPEAWQALTADPTRPTARLHLLGAKNIGVDLGKDTYTLFEDVRHPYRGSLLVMSGRVMRAELWLRYRVNNHRLVNDY